MTATPTEWMTILVFGGFVGMIGQSIRVISGFKKLSDQKTGDQTLSDLVEPSRLMMSLLIGFVAGALGALTLDIKPGEPLSASLIVTLLGIGYAGADFIEAFMHKNATQMTAGGSGSSSGDGAGSIAAGIAADPRAVG